MLSNDSEKYNNGIFHESTIPTFIVAMYLQGKSTILVKPKNVRLRIRLRALKPSTFIFVGTTSFCNKGMTSWSVTGTSGELLASTQTLKASLLNNELLTRLSTFSLHISQEKYLIQPTILTRCVKKNSTLYNTFSIALLP